MEPKLGIAPNAEANCVAVGLFSLEAFLYRNVKESHLAPFLAKLEPRPKLAFGFYVYETNVILHILTRQKVAHNDNLNYIYHW